MLPTAMSFVRCVLFSLSFHVKIQRRLRIFSRGILFLRILETVLVSNQLLISFVLVCSNNCRSLLPNNDNFTSTFCLFAVVAKNDTVSSGVEQLVIAIKSLRFMGISYCHT